MKNILRFCLAFALSVGLVSNSHAQETESLKGKIIISVNTPWGIGYFADADGNLLSDVVAYVNGKVAAGNGMVDGRLSAPVSSVFKVGLSATGDGLSRLNTIEVDLEGRGSGQFNSNEYIKIEKMSLTIDRPVEIDLN